MTENKTPKAGRYPFYAVFAILIAVVAVQAWYMTDMKHEMDRLQSTLGLNSNNAEQTLQNTDNTQNVASRSNAASVTQSPSVAERIQKQLDSTSQNTQQSRNQQTQAQQNQANAGDPHSLFNDDFFNRSFSGQNWNPYREIQRMRQEMDRVFNSAFNDFNDGSVFQHMFSKNSTVPEMRLKEDDSKFTVTLDLPNANEKNVSVNLDGQQLTVNGQQDITEQKKDANGHVVFESHHAESFQRSITLPEPVKRNGMATRVDNGILTITVPKVS